MLRSRSPKAAGLPGAASGPGERSFDLSDLGELYHDYAFFGVKNRQLPHPYPANQGCKAPILRAYIQFAIAKAAAGPATESGPLPVSFTELFCADGYYAMAARRMGARRAIGIDNGRDPFFHLAPAIAARLGIDNIDFINADINRIDTFEPTDIVANLGGLYHIPNPGEILQRSYALAKKFLIVQSVYSLAHTAADYFQTPAPGWTWGSRFSLAWLQNRIATLGGRMLDCHINELAGNERSDDRGSACFLIEKP